MANGFFLPQHQPLDYGPTIAGAGAPVAGLMGGVQSGLQMQAQLEALRQAREQRQAQQSQAGAAQELQAIKTLAAAGDPAAQQQLLALDPESAYKMQQVSGLQQEQQIELTEAQRERVGSTGSLITSASTKNVRATYERVRARIRKEGDSEESAGLPTPAEASKMTDKELLDAMQPAGRQMETFGIGPEAAAKLSLERQKFGKEELTALQRNLQSAGIMPGTQEYRQAMLDSTKKGTTVNVGPQTESQRKDQFMADNVNLALGEINDAIGSGAFNPSSISTMMIDKFGSLANFAKSPEWQAFEGANDAVIEMYLNKTTGAAYSQLQKDAAEKRFKIRPGDTKKTTDLKLQRIKTLANSLNKSAGVPTELAKEVQSPVQKAEGDQNISALSDAELLQLLETM